ncbi:TRAP transporter small permease [Gelria sp. Kuro-4]|jgi:C4-dicarboxylate transporter DctQ subunit|uniref:TRAP transporter small permease n=1 Tax=Gelria sp. Kuro-4 TaxID=2796927 RepID=UPI001BF1306B|nr:TRAP transporter small permease [Gelria sp. Kuro-4]BCV26005.1 C4-dicarboxylate ABC transporter permease [Gelria sp. Kuro-4]
MRKILANFEDKVSAVVLTIMLTLTFVNVIARYCFTASISYTEEITTMLFVLLCTLGSAIAAKRRAHLGLSIVTDMLPESLQRYTGFFTNMLGAVFSLILVYTGVLMVIHEYEIGQISIGLQWPQWIYGTFIPIGGVAMVYRFAKTAIHSLRRLN